MAGAANNLHLHGGPFRSAANGGFDFRERKGLGDVLFDVERLDCATVVAALIADTFAYAVIGDGQELQGSIDRSAPRSDHPQFVNDQRSRVEAIGSGCTRAFQHQGPHGPAHARR